MLRKAFFIFSHGTHSIRLAYIYFKINIIFIIFQIHFYFLMPDFLMKEQKVEERKKKRKRFVTVAVLFSKVLKYHIYKKSYDCTTKI